MALFTDDLFSPALARLVYGAVPGGAPLYDTSVLLVIYSGTIPLLLVSVKLSTFLAALVLHPIPSPSFSNPPGGIWLRLLHPFP